MNAAAATDIAEDVRVGVHEARHDGAGVLRAVFDATQVDFFRSLVLANRRLFRNTRPTPSAGHLAGFHRHPALEPLHTAITTNPTLAAAVGALCGPDARTVGMSDITINRSQPWHKDLLRGTFRHHLPDGGRDNCARWHGTVFKLLVYAQPSSSLQFVAGSHRHDIPLEDDASAVPGPSDDVRRVAVSTGDVVIQDVCTTHRGADEAAFQDPAVVDHPRILLSTVFGAADSELTPALELGNAIRLAEWMRRT